MNQKFNPNHLQPGQPLNTLAGPATFVRMKPDNFREQNYQVQMENNGAMRWYTADELRRANRPAPVPEDAAYEVPGLD